jgi:hypothetical protein
LKLFLKDLKNKFVFPIKCVGFDNKEQRKLFNILIVFYHLKQNLRKIDQTQPKASQSFTFNFTKISYSTFHLIKFLKVFNTMKVPKIFSHQWKLSKAFKINESSQKLFIFFKFPFKPFNLPFYLNVDDIFADTKRTYTDPQPCRPKWQRSVVPVHHVAVPVVNNNI